MKEFFNLKEKIKWIKDESFTRIALLTNLIAKFLKLFGFEGFSLNVHKTFRSKCAREENLRSSKFKRLLTRCSVLWIVFLISEFNPVHSICCNCVNEARSLGKYLNEDLKGWRDDRVEKFNLKRWNASFFPVHHKVGVEPHLSLQVALGEEFCVDQLCYSLNSSPWFDLVV